MSGLGLVAVVGAAVVKVLQVRAIIVAREPGPFKKLVALERA